MKTLSADTIVSTINHVETTADNLQKALARLTPIYSHHRMDVSKLGIAVADGNIQAVTFKINGEDSHVVFYTKSVDDGLHINATVCLTNGIDRWCDIMSGLNDLAKQQNAKYITFHTARSGLIKKAMNSGYQPEAVYFRKILI